MPVSIWGGGSTIADTTTVLDYSSSTGFTYTAADVEFASGVCKLKSQYASDVTFAANFTSSLDAVYSKFGGSLTASTSGTVSASGGKADLSGASGAFKKLEYSGSLNFPPNGVGAVKFKVTPGYSGTPGTRQFYLTSSMGVGSTVNTVFWEHHTDGRVYYYVYNSSGATIFTTDFAWNPTADQTYEVYAYWDVNTGVSGTMIDGVSQVTSTATGARDNRITYFKFGAAEGDVGTDHAHYKIDDLVVYNAVQETAGYTPGYTVSDTQFVTTDPVVERTTGLTCNKLKSFIVTSSASGSDGVKYHIKVDGTARYWDGAAWADSDGTYAQSNTATDINSNAELLISSSASLKVCAVLHSDSGSTTPTVSSVTLITE